MKLFVGLGNPGAAYAGHRHNVGFMAADRIAAAHSFGAWRSRFQGQCAEGQLGGEKCLLLKPMTYMNESGRAAGEAARYYKLAPEDVVVIYDEIDLAPGKVRVKSGGGAAGHNGVRSLASHVGDAFTRVRIGIGHPGSKHKVQGYVLRDFPKGERDWLDPLLDAIAEAAPKLAKGDASGFMNAVALSRGEPPLQGEAVKKTSGEARRSAAASSSAGDRKAPSQRELARRAAERAEARDAAKETPTARRGPFARLRDLFGAGN